MERARRLRMDRTPIRIITHQSARFGVSGTVRISYLTEGFVVIQIEYLLHGGATTVDLPRPLALLPEFDHAYSDLGIDDRPLCDEPQCLRMLSRC
jgi:hypothetical protein